MSKPAPRVRAAGGRDDHGEVVCVLCLTSVKLGIAGFTGLGRGAGWFAFSSCWELNASAISLTLAPPLPNPVTSALYSSNGTMPVSAWGSMTARSTRRTESRDDPAPVVALPERRDRDRHDRCEADGAEGRNPGRPAGLCVSPAATTVHSGSYARMTLRVST